MDSSPQSCDELDPDPGPFAENLLTAVSSTHISPGILSDQDATRNRELSAYSTIASVVDKITGAIIGHKASTSTSSWTVSRVGVPDDFTDELDQSHDWTPILHQAHYVTHASSRIDRRNAL